MEQDVWVEFLPQLLQILFAYFTSFVIAGCHSVISSPRISMWIISEINCVISLGKNHPVLLMLIQKYFVSSPTKHKSIFSTSYYIINILLCLVEQNTKYYLLRQ